MNWKFWEKKVVKDQPKKYKSVLTVYLDQSVFRKEYFSWSNPVENKNARYAPWIDFIKWMYFRHQSPCFAFKYKNGETMVQRIHMLGYSIVVREIKQEKP